MTSKIDQFSWPPTKAIYVTSGQAVSGQAFGFSSMMDCCNHEEADTRIVVHLQHALKQGAKTVLVRTVDTDVIVILAGLFNDLVVLQPLTDIWVAFGMGKRFILPIDRSSILLVFFIFRLNSCQFWAAAPKGREKR